MPVTSMHPRYPSKWDRAKRVFNRRLAELNNDALATIEYFNGEALRAQRLARENPASQGKYFEWLYGNCATYGVNLAFGKDLAKKS